MLDNYTLIRFALKNESVSKKLLKIVQAGGGFEVLSTTDARRPDLLIFELGDNHQKDINLVKSLLEGDDVGEVFLTSESVDPAVLMQAMRIGVKEFISQPISENEVRQALEGFRKRQSESVECLPRKNGKIISIFGSI